MDQLPQLTMRIDLRAPLPTFEGRQLAIHTENERSPSAWEWIISDSFQRPFSYDFIRKDEAYAPERVFFAQDYSQDAATACAFFRTKYPGEGYIHMVGTHSWYRGENAGGQVVRAALQYFQNAGLPSAVLTTDDFRLSAIATYRRLGFQPVMDHESAPSRWAEVEKVLAKFEKKPRTPLPLWPDEAPYTKESGEQAQPSLEPYPVADSRGAMIVCPGGGYTIKAHHEGTPIARMLNSASISAYVLDYRVTPCPVDAPLCDALRAIRLVRSMGYEKVGIMGFSAGGHISACAATRYDEGTSDSPDPVERYSSRPDAFAPCYPLISTISFRKGRPDGDSVLELMLREEDLRRRYSAELHVTAQTPPAFLWHTANDAVVPIRQSLLFADALATHGVPFELHVFPDGPHGLGLAGGVPGVNQWPALCQRFLLAQGFGPRA